MTQADSVSKTINILHNYAKSDTVDQALLNEALTNLEVLTSTETGLRAIDNDRKILGQSLLELLFKNVHQQIIDQSCGVLARIGLQQLTLQQLALALESNNHSVIKLALTLVQRNEADIQKQIIGQSSLSQLSLIVAFMGSPSVEIFKLANDILIQIARSPNVDIVFYNWLSSELSPVLQNPKYSLRGYQLIADLATISPQTFQFCEMASLLSFATGFDGDSFSSDILEAIAVVELFVEISSLPNGALFLQSTQVLDKMASILASNMEKAGDTFALLAAIKFYGFFSFNQPDLFEQIESTLSIFRSLKTHLESDNYSVKDAVLVAVANTASSPQGLLLLSQERLFLQAVLDIVPTATGDLKVSALRALSCILSHGNVPDCNQISREIFEKCLGRSPMSSLRTLGQNSIPEVSIASLSILKETVTFDWGLEALANNSDTCAFLMERGGGEEEKLVTEWKYSIIQKLALDQRSKDVFAPTVFNKMVEHAKAGPWKTAYTPAVAYASN